MTAQYALMSSPAICLNLFEGDCTSNCCIFDRGSIVLVWNIPTKFSQNTALQSSLVIFNREVQPMIMNIVCMLTTYTS